MVYLGKVEEEEMNYDLRLGDLIECAPHGQALLVGAVDGGNTFIVAVEKSDRVVYTVITKESIKYKFEPSPRLLRIKNASFGTDVLAQLPSAEFATYRDPEPTVKEVEKKR